MASNARIDIRLPDDLKAQIIEAAQGEGRSVNNYIVQSLRKSLSASESQSLKICKACFSRYVGDGLYCKDCYS